jgi:hypothetical protein
MGRGYGFPPQLIPSRSIKPGLLENPAYLFMVDFPNKNPIFVEDFRAYHV